VPNGVIRVDQKKRTWQLVANLSAFLRRIHRRTPLSTISNLTARGSA
jgi:hypothetical protein